MMIFKKFEKLLLLCFLHGVGLRLWRLTPLLTLFQLCHGSQFHGVKNKRLWYLGLINTHVCNKEEEAKATIVQQMIDQNFIKNILKINALQ